MVEVGNIYLISTTQQTAEVLIINGQDVSVLINGTRNEIWQLGDMEDWIEKGIKQKANDENDIEFYLTLIN